jgi:hypothetical protein
MTLEWLQAIIDVVVDNPPPDMVSLWCGDYYMPYYNLLCALSFMLDPKGLAVELGVEKGRGLASLAAGSRARIVGFDTTRRSEISKLLDEFSNVEFIHGPSLPPTDLGQPVDILHIDTEHSYSMAREEFYQWKSFLAPGAVVLFDDLHAMEDGVLRLFNELPYPKIQDDRLHPVCGYGVLLYEEIDE